MTKVFSMFSGIGGFEVGLLMSEKDVKLVGFSEVDKYAIEIFEKQFKGIKNYGNATTIDETELPNFDLLVGGFPCQAFSVAGKRKGFEDTRGTLFFDIARILSHKKPKHFILENVKGLLSHDNGRTMQKIFEVLADIGYMVQWQVLNSKNFGVPQNRERVYIVGHLRGRSRPEVFPIRESQEVSNTGRKEEGQGSSEVSSTITSNYKRGVHAMGEQYVMEPKELTKDISMAYRVYDTDGVSTTLKAVGGGVGAKTGLYQVKACLTPDRKEKRQNGRRFKDHEEPMFTLTSQDKHGVMITEATKKGYAIAEEGDSINLTAPTSKTRRGRVGKKIANTIDTGMQQYTLVKYNYGQKSLNETLEKSNLKDDDIKALDLYNRKAKDICPTLTEPHHNSLRLYERSKIRRLTPTECERLQGFPDGWTEGISDTQRYKCLGNAVTTNVVCEIAKRLIK